MLSSRQRGRLAGIAQTMPDLVQLGRAGASEALIARLGVLLADHELVKLRFVDHKGERTELAAALAAATGSEIVRLIGNTAVFWKRNPDPKRRKVEIDVS